ncbi:cell division protein MraZ [Methyloligella halotolerans]|uniref:Transcriptional regulator MraZ n=1 Tax=Methyloligella halotolerans TaxID=1177755 RepID=A0A1E2S3W9_9HYPH|nr:cell division protein MraZ [Methyloligella halotolerans]ODA69025.1 cell division protein MraZ [Methyloligella halotolerans]
MDSFVSSFTNRIDSKGRVSVPASFRTILAQEGFDGIYCYPSLDRPALDGGGQRLVDQIDKLIGELAPYSDEHDYLATALYGTSDKLSVDGDGRTIIPERLRVHAGIEDAVTFVGMGPKFQMWEPAQFKEYMAESQRQARDLRNLLGAGHKDGGPASTRE